MKSNIAAIVLLLSVQASIAQTRTAVTKINRKNLADTIERSMRKEMLDAWYPKNIDKQYGGFLTGYTYDFKPTGAQDKFIVTQARHTWTNARAAQRYPGVTHYLQSAKHGYVYLRDVLWDKQYGGFYNVLSRDGKDKSNPQAPKESYGNSFAIYALAAYYKASRDTAALGLAKKTFRWLDQHAHDKVNKGYYQHLQRNGDPVVRDAGIPSTSDIGYKDQNSSIHLLEAFTELYQVWKDEVLRERVNEMLVLIRDRLVTPQGYLRLFFTADWTPVSYTDSSEATILKHRYLDHVSFGHDVETAYLLLEASHVLNRADDALTFEVAKRMLDHSLAVGWDDSLGGFWDEGYYFKDKPGITIIKKTKNWWTQAEGLNTLLLMADLNPSDSHHYYALFKQQWNYINTYMIDHTYGDWYDEGLDRSPERKTALKGHIWKAIYHQYRALSHCIDALRR